MAIRLNITPQDVKATKLVRPGWYNVRINEVKEELAKDKESTNIVVDVLGAEGDADGVPIKNWFSEKFPQGGISFVKACGGSVSEDQGVDPSFDWERQAGKVVKAHIVTSRGKDGQQPPRNVIDEWAPLASVGEAAAVPAGGFDTL
jgi:hypothetical protein